MTTTHTASESKEAGRLGLPQYLGYAGGDVANNLTFSLASMFLLLYYTDVVCECWLRSEGGPCVRLRCWHHGMTHDVVGALRCLDAEPSAAGAGVGLAHLAGLLAACPTRWS